MLRLSKLTDYAVVVLVQLSRGQVCQTAPGIARSTGVPEPTVAKVLKALAAARIVTSQRGARGGYSLSLPADTIDVASVVTAIEGPIALVACVEGSGKDCDAHHLCPARGRWDVVNTAIRAALSAISLADLDRGPAPHLRVAPPAAVQPASLAE